MITYHHVGGRSGTFPLPLTQGPLLKDIHLILYDADPSCADQMAENLNDGFGKVSIFPFCIGAKRAKRNFHLNFHPTTSSLYPFDPYFQFYNYIDPHYGEFRLGQACQTMKTVNMELVTLKDCVKDTNITSIDFLSMDVQGAEYEIIKGAKKILKDTCVGLQLELSFNPFYKKLAPFTQLHHLLTKLNFELLDMHSFVHFGKTSLPAGFHGKGQLISGEAVYIKKSETLNPKKDQKQLLKIALFSLINANIGHCLSTLNRLQGIPIDASGDDASYVHLLLEIQDMIVSAKEYIFPTLADIFSHSVLKLLYNPKSKEQFNQLKQEALRNLSKQKQSMIDKVAMFLQQQDTPFEKLLLKYELQTVEQMIKNNRQEQRQIFHNLFSEQLAGI